MNAEWAAERMAETPAFRTPWDPTLEQWEKESHYAPYVAWESWLGTRLEESAHDDAFLAWEEMGILARIDLFVAMTAACQFAAENRP